MMLFIKKRGINPLSEEKQILDGIKLILDNNWMIETKEMLQFFSIIGLQFKAKMLIKHQGFQEFLFALSELFELDRVAVQ